MKFVDLDVIVNMGSFVSWLIEIFLYSFNILYLLFILNNILIMCGKLNKIILKIFFIRKMIFIFFVKSYCLLINYKCYL